MKVSWYNNSIRIAAATRETVMGAWGPYEDITDATQADLFIRFTKLQLDEIAGLSSGQKLINEISNSNHKVTICMFKNAAGNVTAAAAANATTAMEKFFKPIRRPPEAQRRWMLANLGDFPRSQVNQPQQVYAITLRNAINRSPYTEDQLARLVVDDGRRFKQIRARDWAEAGTVKKPGLWTRARDKKIWVEDKDFVPQEKAFAEMMDGTREMDDSTYFRLVLTLHDWLTPGDGVDTVIAYSAGPEGTCKEDPNPKADHEKYTAPFIVLGHELVHAWRMMTGRRVFIGGLGEEHMTTGLPPYTSMRFSENKLRAESNHAIRDYYTAMAHDVFSGTLGMTWMMRQQGFAEFWSKSVDKRSRTPAF
jgi:cold shock CspA family protein